MDINQREHEQEQQSTNRNVRQEARIYHTRRGAEVNPAVGLAFTAAKITKLSNVQE